LLHSTVLLLTKIVMWHGEYSASWRRSVINPKTLNAMHTRLVVRYTHLTDKKCQASGNNSDRLFQYSIGKDDFHENQRLEKVQSSCLQAIFDLSVVLSVFFVYNACK